MEIAALVVATTLIAVGGTLVARSDWSVAPRGRAGVVERLWVVLPAAFLVLLVVLAARAALA
jgi:hypothetical protein